MDIFLIIVCVIFIYINQFVQKSKKKEYYSAKKVASANKITNGLKVEKLLIGNIEKDKKNKNIEIFITDEEYIFCVWKFQGLFLKEVGKINKSDIKSIYVISLKERIDKHTTGTAKNTMQQFLRENPQIGRERDTIYFDDSHGNPMAEITTKTEKIANKLLLLVTSS